MRIRPTALGWKGLLLLGALECAYLATAYSNLFFLLITFCLAIGALGAWWTLANLRGLRVVRLDMPGAAAGRSRDLTCVLAAPRSRCDLHVGLVLADGVAACGHATRIDGQHKVSGTLPPRPRSVEPVRALRLWSHFPLGLFVARVDLPIDAEVVTWPDPEAATAPNHASTENGRLPLARSASVQELRPFRAGDSLGDVHWKASARRGQPVVKEREREGDRLRTFVLDRRATPAALESGLAALAGAVLAAREGQALRLLSQGADLKLTHDDSGASAALRWLAAASPLPADAPPPPSAPGAVHLPPRRDAVEVST